MSERKLATIRRIDEIRPILNADAIECAVLGGWQVVVRKNDYQPGQLVVYFEIDSWIPTEIAPFLSKGKEPREYKGVRGERLKTIRLRGQISQGLLLQRKEIPGFLASTQLEQYPEGMNLTEIFNIQKYEQAEKWCSNLQAKGNFPSFIFKTDQERIQNLKREFEGWKTDDSTWEVSEKLDGSSMTVYWNKETNENGVCSRNVDLRYDADNLGTFWAVAQQEQLIEKLCCYGKSYALQGELIGPGIQGNPYKLSVFKFYLYNVFDIEKQEYLLPYEAQEFCKKLDINYVPVIQNDWPICPRGLSLEHLIMCADGKSMLNFETVREGLVFKNTATQESFKVISNDFLCRDKT